MKLEDFDFNLPHDLIAKAPASPRDTARLMIIGKGGEKKDDHFYNLQNYFKKGDVLVFNNTKVFPARLVGKSENGKEVEIFLLEEKQNADCLIRPAKIVKNKLDIIFSERLKGACFRGKNGFKIKFNLPDDDLVKEIKKIGDIPLPPYILKERGEKKSRRKDCADYQTIFAKDEGSVAAPTAGLHFTKELIQKIKDHGVEMVEITLHVGLGTFEPIREEDYKKHKMHFEKFTVNPNAAKKLTDAKKEKRRIIAVGTTTARVLESIIKNSEFDVGSGETDIFIYPGYKFQAIDGLITNFHLPKSSLLLLVSAFAGKDKVLKSYGEAIKRGYRFYSYGDGMLLLK